MPGVVRGRIELDAPALVTLKDLQKQGIKTEAQLKAVGEQIDKVGKKWIKSTEIMKKEVNAQQRAISDLEASMDWLDKKTIRPKINVEGITEALTQVSILESRLNALDRRSVSPRVSGVGGGGAPFGGGGGGGGGGGRRAGPFDLGLPGIRPRNVLMGLGAAYARPLIGGATSLIGSAGSGLLGGAAVGAAGGLGLGIGAGSTFAVAKGLIRPIGEAKKAQDAYNESVALYGRLSTQARTAKLKLDQAYASSPGGTRTFLRNLGAVQSNWHSGTADGRASLLGGANVGLAAANRLMPSLTRAANRSSAATGREGGRLANWVAGGTGQQALSVGSGIYDDNLGRARQAAQYGMEAFVNTAQAARPYLREFTEFVKDWARGWSTPTRDIEHQREEIGKLVDHLKVWGDMGGSGFTLIKDILSASAPSGSSMLVQFTQTLDRWDEYVKGHPREVSNFFEESATSVEKLAGGLGHVVGMLNDMAKLFGPLLNHFSELAGLAGSLGLLAPGAFMLARGAVGGLRGGGAAGGGGGGAAGSGGMMAGMLGMGMMGRGGGGAVAGGAGAVRAGSGVFGRAYESTMIARAYGGSGRAGALGARSMGGSLRAGGASIMGSAGLAGRAALVGAGKAYLPIGLALGALDAYGFQGNVGEKATAGLSTFTLGAVPRPKTASQLKDAATASTQDFLRPGKTVAQIDAELARLGERQTHKMGVLHQLATGNDNKFFGIGMGGTGLSHDENKENQTRIKLLTQERKALIETNRENRKRHAALVGEDERQRGAAYAGRLGVAYNRYRKRGMTAAQANAHITSNLTDTLGRQRSAQGVEEVGEQGLSFLKSHGGTEAQVRRLTRNIRRQFREMGKDIRIINGDILTGSKAEWRKIGQAITDPAFDALSKTSTAFKAIRDQAVAELGLMGFSKKDAQQLFKDIDTGGIAGKRANNVINSGPGGATLRLDAPKKHGTSGDGVGHTISHAAGAPGRKSGGSALMGADPALGGYASIGSRYGLHVSSGDRPGAITSSGNVSLHASGDAIDETGSGPDMLRYAKYMAEHYGSGLDELIHTPLGYGIKNGRKVPLSFWGSKINAQHMNHVHVGDRTPSSKAGGGVAGGSGGDAGPGTGKKVNLRAPKSGLGGAPGALADGASALYAGALTKKINKSLGSGGGATAHGGSGPYDAQALADLWKQAGGPSSKAQLMAAIALAESGGSPTAHNPSGATGLWQILGNPFPGNARNPLTNAKMAVSKYKSQGLGAWEAYTNGSYRKYYGGRGPSGDGTGVPRIGRSPIQRRPATPMRFSGGGVTVQVSMGDVHVRSDADIDAIANRVGQKVLAAMEG